MMSHTVTVLPKILLIGIQKTSKKDCFLIVSSNLIQFGLNISTLNYYNVSVCIFLDSCWLASIVKISWFLGFMILLNLGIFYAPCPLAGKLGILVSEKYNHIILIYHCFISVSLFSWKLKPKQKRNRNLNLR